MAFRGTQYAITTAAVSLTAALGLVSATRLYPCFISFRNKTGNTTVAYIGPSTVTNVPANARESIIAGERLQLLPPTGGHLNTDEIFIVGSVGAEPIFITVID